MTQKGRKKARKEVWCWKFFPLNGAWGFLLFFFPSLIFFCVRSVFPPYTLCFSLSHIHNLIAQDIVLEFKQRFSTFFYLHSFSIFISFSVALSLSFTLFFLKHISFVMLYVLWFSYVPHFSIYMLFFILVQLMLKLSDDVIVNNSYVWKIGKSFIACSVNGKMLKIKYIILLIQIKLLNCI